MIHWHGKYAKRARWYSKHGHAATAEVLLEKIQPFLALNLYEMPEGYRAYIEKVSEAVRRRGEAKRWYRRRLARRLAGSRRAMP